MRTVLVIVIQSYDYGSFATHNAGNSCCLLPEVAAEDDLPHFLKLRGEAFEKQPSLGIVRIANQDDFKGSKRFRGKFTEVRH
jgi:hypothetical protein